jgi:hypothetical protein
VELAVAMVVMLIAIGTLTSSVLSGMKLARANEETAQADQALRAFAEQLTATDFADVFATYNDDPEDDPGGEGTAPGASFAVAGLVALEDDEDGLVGSVNFPGMDDFPGELHEDIEDTRFGTPLDLNVDEALDDEDHANDYVVLPVLIRLDWTGISGARHLELSTVLFP